MAKLLAVVLYSVSMNRADAWDVRCPAGESAAPTGGRVGTRWDMSTPGFACNFLSVLLAMRAAHPLRLRHWKGAVGIDLSACVPRLAPPRLQRIQRIADASGDIDCA